jgi:hypothetical protein
MPGVSDSSCEILLRDLPKQSSDRQAQLCFQKAIAKRDSHHRSRSEHRPILKKWRFPWLLWLNISMQIPL